MRMGRDTFRKETRRKLSNLQKQIVRILVGPLYSNFLNLTFFGVHRVRVGRIVADVTDHEGYVVNFLTWGQFEFFVKLLVGIEALKQCVACVINDCYIIGIPGIVFKLNIENLISFLGT